MGRRKAARGPAGAQQAELRRWLRARTGEAVRHGRPISSARPFRTSSKSLEQFKGNLNSSLASNELAHDPDVIRAVELGYAVVRTDDVGRATRKKLGSAVFELRMHHLPGGHGRERLGVILHIGTTFFIYLLSSARAENLSTESEGRAGNAATEVICAAVSAMWSAGRKVPDYRPHVYAREHERIIRDEEHGVRTKKVFVKCRVIAHLPHTVDMTDPAAQTAFSFGTMMAAHAADLVVTGMARASLLMQADGATMWDTRSFPFTHEARVERDKVPGTTRYVTSENIHRAAPVSGADLTKARTVLRELVDALLQDPTHGRDARPPLDWDAAVSVAVKRRIPSRGKKDIKNGTLILHKRPEGRRRCVRSLFGPRWIEGWRTGQFEITIPAMTAAIEALDPPGATKQTDEDGAVSFICYTEMPLPADGAGWGITDAEWDELIRRRDRSPSGTRRVLNNNVHPLVGVVPAAEDGEERKLMSKYSYALYRRLAEPGNPGWGEDAAKVHEATMRPPELHASLAAAAAADLTHLEESVEVIAVNATSPSRPPGDADTTAQRRLELERAAEDAEEDLAAATDELRKARRLLRQGKAGELDVRRAERAHSKAQERGDAAQSLLRTHREDAHDSDTPREQVTEEVQVGAATPEFVIAALTKTSGSAPPWLREACFSLFTDWRMDLRPVEGGRDNVDWSCTMLLDIAGADEPLRRELSGTVPNRMTTASGERAASSPEEWAWAFLYLARSFAEIGAASHVDGSGRKNSHLYGTIYRWLGDAIPDTNLRTAALLCPVPETRRVLWAMATGCSAALAGIDPGFASHIERIYSDEATRPSWSWVRDTQTLPRRTARLLANAPGVSLAEHELVARLKIALRLLNELSRVHRVATDEAFRSKTVAYFVKSYPFGVKHKNPDENRVLLRSCPHDDCPARLAGGQAYCSIVLSTPETDPGSGVLCERCLRLPDAEYKDVWFPPSYRRPWASPFGHGSRALGPRRRIGFTFLDPEWPDPGPGSPLPDPGCRPTMRLTLEDEAETAPNPGV